MPSSKIATCCYCGTRAALTLRGREQHELACSNCGAPLSELKMLRLDVEGDREVKRPSPTRQRGAKKRRYKKPRRRRQKSLSQRFMHELWDLAEEAFDLFD